MSAAQDEECPCAVQVCFSERIRRKTHAPVEKIQLQWHYYINEKRSAIIEDQLNDARRNLLA
jgi:hypothetical protein